MRKLSSKKKMRKSRSKDEESPGSPESSVNLEANENGGKNEDESSDSESDNSKTVKRKSRKNATTKKKIVEANNSADEDAEEAKPKEDENGDDVEKDGEDEEEEEEYEVQDIVDEKEEKGVTLFLIRWKGYGPDDDTWEPEDTLSCPEIIARFQKKKKPGRKGAPKTKKAASKQPKAKKRKIQKDDDEDADGDGEPADPEKQWEVARIINVGYEKGVRLFKVRWKGYRSKDDTWEPEENLNCHDLIDRFLKGMEKSNKLDQKELREQPQRTQRFGGDSYRRGSKRNAGKSRTVYYEEDE